MLATLAAGCGGSSPSASPTTTSTTPRRGFGPDTVAESIAGAAASAAIDQAMTALGLPTTSNELKAIQDRLNQIDQRLTAIQAFLADARLEGRCEAARSKAADILSLIDDGQKKLKEASAPTDPAKRKERLEKLDSYVYNTLDSRQQRLNDILVGKNEQSLITHCGRYLESKEPELWTRADSMKLWKFMEGYGYAESVLQGLREGYRKRNGSDAEEIKSFEADFKSQIAAQDALVKPILPENTFLDRRQNGLLWRMTANQLKMGVLRTGSPLPAWASGDGLKGWGISGFKTQRPNCADLVSLKRLAAAGFGKFADWLVARGMIGGQGSYGKQVACYNVAPVPFGGFRMFNAPALHTTTELLSIPADDVVVNVVEGRKPGERQYSYISTGEAP